MGDCGPERPPCKPIPRCLAISNRWRFDPTAPIGKKTVTAPTGLLREVISVEATREVTEAPVTAARAYTTGQRREAYRCLGRH